MNTRLVPEIPAEVMTWRARGYLGIAGLRHLAIGTYALTSHDDFVSDAYQVIAEILPIRAWGAIFFLGGIHLTYAAIRGREGHARVGLTLSAVTTSLWAIGFFMAFFVGGVVTLVGGIIFTALTGKDLVVCAQPMRSPFERFVREYVNPTSG